MARRPRIQAENGLYHVISKGARGGMLFRDALDRYVFEDVLMIAQAGWICHAYCSLGTHYHLLIETPEPNKNRAAARRQLRWFVEGTELARAA